MGLFQSKEQQTEADAVSQHAASDQNTDAMDATPTMQDNEPEKQSYNRRKRDSRDVSSPTKMTKRQKTTRNQKKSSSTKTKVSTPTNNVRKSQETPSLKKTSSVDSSKKTRPSQKTQSGRERHTEALWESKFQKLMEYKQEHGDCLVPTHYVKDESLGNWVHCQRQMKRTGGLRDDRFAKLESIGFVWNVKKTVAAEKAKSGRLARKQKK